MFRDEANTLNKFHFAIGLDLGCIKALFYLHSSSYYCYWTVDLELIFQGANIDGDCQKMLWPLYTSGEGTQKLHSSINFTIGASVIITSAKSRM